MEATSFKVIIEEKTSTIKADLAYMEAVTTVRYTMNSSAAHTTPSD